MNKNRLHAIALLVLYPWSLSSAMSATPQTQAHDGQIQGAVSYGLENPEVRRGYDAIVAAIALVPGTTGQRERLRAQIAYALDQTKLDCPTTLAALDTAARQPGLTRATYGAVRDVTSAASRCDGNGIAGIDGSSAGLLLDGGPGIGFGGGTSNYTGR